MTLPRVKAQATGVTGTWDFDPDRPDVIDSLLDVNAMQKAYRLRKKPTPERMRKIGEAWRPYRSIASWYLWRSLDPPPLKLRRTSNEPVKK